MVIGLVLLLPGGWRRRVNPTLPTKFGHSNNGKFISDSAIRADAYTLFRHIHVDKRIYRADTESTQEEAKPDSTAVDSKPNMAEPVKYGHARNDSLHEPEPEPPTLISGFC